MKKENADKIVNEWIKKYSDTFFNYLHNRVFDKTTAKEILQETFIAGWKNYSAFKNISDEKTWLFSILKNKLVDHYRNQARLKTDLPDDKFFFDNADHWTEQASPMNWQGATTSLNRNEFYTVLDKCKKNLTPLQQLTFSMKYIDELETGLICKVLNITASNYWVIIHRSKVQLRNCLEKNWFGNK